MGQKVNPIGFRVGITTTGVSTWFSKKNYAEYMLEDIKVRKYIKTSIRQSGVSKILIERPTKSKLIIFIHASKPGVIIGKKGADIEKVKAHLTKLTNCEVTLNIVEVKKPEVDSALIAQNIADQLEKRVSFRRAMKKSMQTAQKYGAKGIKISCSGRLGGAEIARTEGYMEGRVPLHTLKANIDYGFAEAFTTYGIIGVKVLVYHGDVLKDEKTV